MYANDMTCKTISTAALLTLVIAINNILYSEACRQCILHPTLLPFVGVSPRQSFLQAKLTPQGQGSSSSTLFVSHSSTTASSKISKLVMHEQKPEKFGEIYNRNQDEIADQRRLMEVLNEGHDSIDKDDTEEIAANDSTNDSDISSVAMISSIKFYKFFISPLLPPACRFLPTCSQYGIQAIQDFGPAKGIVLTVWRLLRCSPIGGRGYDPPVWPPVFYTFGSY